MHSTPPKNPFRTIARIVITVATLQVVFVLVLYIYLFMHVSFFRSDTGIFLALVALTEPLILLSLGYVILAASSFASVPSDLQTLTATVVLLRRQLEVLSTVVRSQEEAIKDSAEKLESDAGNALLNGEDRTAEG